MCVCEYVRTCTCMLVMCRCVLCVCVHPACLVLHRMVQYCHDEAAQFVHILAGPHSGRTYLVEDDFLCLIQVQHIH